MNNDKTLKIGVIGIYFGKLPNWFPIWLQIMYIYLILH